MAAGKLPLLPPDNDLGQREGVVILLQLCKTWNVNSFQTRQVSNNVGVYSVGNTPTKEFLMQAASRVVQHCWIDSIHSKP
jgi:hypothetical protein